MILTHNVPILDMGSARPIETKKTPAHKSRNGRISEKISCFSLDSASIIPAIKAPSALDNPSIIKTRPTNSTRPAVAKTNTSRLPILASTEKIRGTIHRPNTIIAAMAAIPFPICGSIRRIASTNVPSDPPIDSITGRISISGITDKSCTTSHAVNNSP